MRICLTRLGSPWVVLGVVTSWLFMNTMLFAMTEIKTPVRVRRDPLMVEQTSRGMIVRDPNSESWDAATKVMANTADTAWLTQLEVNPISFGAPVKMLTREVYALTCMPRVESAAMFKEVRRAAAAEYVRLGDLQDAETARRLEDGPAVRTVWWWRGMVWNALLVLGCIAAGNALIMFVGWAKRRRLARLRDEGICQYCGYEMKGLNTGKCPECGTILKIDH